MAIQRKQRSIELRSSVSEESPAGSTGSNLVEIKCSSQDNVVLILFTSIIGHSPTGISHDSSGRISDEGSSIEVDETLVSQLLTHTVARNNRDIVGLRYELNKILTAE